MRGIDFKSVRPNFLVALWIVLIICLAGVTYLLADIERRLGKIEHCLSHSISERGTGDNCNVSKKEEAWQK